MKFNTSLVDIVDRIMNREIKKRCDIRKEQTEEIINEIKK